ncbi:Uu.00g085710.m01.CDS01 [Anthostomella pinea]|uniref:Uu.00g085710.m01.CDS01 n=1 Tax=Anthostomella pinea TaxID=933095 RepID=A0AAI8VLZ9_9PEZI|nr:Uu.00g085710.m01.CDS01 [Anthostomella pinea]
MPRSTHYRSSRSTAVNTPCNTGRTVIAGNGGANPVYDDMLQDAENLQSLLEEAEQGLSRIRTGITGLVVSGAAMDSSVLDLPQASIACLLLAIITLQLDMRDQIREQEAASDCPAIELFHNISSRLDNIERYILLTADASYDLEENTNLLLADPSDERQRTEFEELVGEFTIYVPGIMPSTPSL